MRLPSQVALVTGAASGIARAVAIRFAREGAAVMVADASERGGMETAEQIRASGGKALFARLDVSQPEEVKQVVRRTMDELGDLHILFNGAGILTYGTALETTEDAWNRMMAVNLTGTFLCSKAALAHMVAKGGASSSMSLRPPVRTTHALTPPPMCVQGRSHAADAIHGNRLCETGNSGERNLPGSHRYAHVAQRSDARRTRGVCQDISHEPARAARRNRRRRLFLASEDASFVTGALL